MSNNKPDGNPFYAMVVLVGVVFLVTAMSYVMALVRLENQPAATTVPARVNPAMQFLEQRGGSLLLWEAGVLTVIAVLAMALDRWRSGQTLIEIHLESPAPRTDSSVKD